MNTIKRMILLSVLLLMISANSWASKNIDLLLIDINDLGHEKVNLLKSNQQLSFWVELGAELLLASEDIDALKLPQGTKQLQLIKGLDQDLLYLETKGLCHSHSQHHKKSTTTSLFIRNLYEIKLASSQEEKLKQMSEACFSELKKNTSIISLAENLSTYKSALVPDREIEAVLNEVDQERWLNNVKYLSSFNRMEEEDLIVTGNWLFDKFQNLGLSVTRLEKPNLYRGFNVIGTKRGTVRPNDWYVIGAHLDSFNSIVSSTSPSPGAEDNASGCSGVIEAAEILSQYESEATILFICFAGHERRKNYNPGLIINGSHHMVEEWEDSGELANVKGMFNMDMISFHEGGDYKALASNAQSIVSLDLFNKFLENARLYTSIEWLTQTNFRFSDNREFSAKGIPEVMSSETTLRSYFGYHGRQDLWQNLDPYLGSQIIKANLATLIQLSGVKLPEISGLPINSNHSGLWFNPSQSGHGFVILVLPGNRVNAQWYVYDNSGNQVWLLGTGSYTEGSDEVTLEMAVTQNGMFPPDFNPDDVELLDWGTLTFQFDGCYSGTASWNPSISLDQFTAGSMDMAKLAELRDLTDCEGE